MKEKNYVRLFSKLPSHELQTKIGQETLKKLEEVLPYLDLPMLRHPNDIYERTNLAKILVSFVGQDAIAEKTTRKQLLEHLPEDELRALANRLRIRPNESVDTLTEKIASIKWGPNENTKEFVNFFDLPEDIIPAEKPNLPNIEVVLKPKTPIKPLKAYQSKIFERSKEQLNYPPARFIIQMPTGSGKTRAAMELICDKLNENDKSILWLAHSEELCEQAIACFKETWSHLGTKDIDLIRVLGKNNLKLPMRPSFIVAGFAKLNLQLKNNKELAKTLSNELQIIVVDEAHKSTATTYEETLKKLLLSNINLSLIGLTATPGRGSLDSKETENLVKLYRGGLLQIETENKDDTVFEYLRKQKILAQIELDPLIMSHTKYELNEGEKKYLENFFDFPPEFLSKIADDNIRNLEIITKLKKECNSEKKILFFGVTVAHSKFICAILRTLGLNAEHLDGETGSARRQEIIERFKYGDLNVLCNFGILTTGFDAPKTDVVFIARPTMSVVLYSQMVGRGLRGPAVGGKEVTKLIDVKDNIDAYQSPDNVYDYFEGYWQ